MNTSVVDQQIDEAELPCRTHGPELYFAESPSDVELAKALCQGCPVRAECLAGALERREPWGVWGGELFLQGVVIPRKRPRGRPARTPRSSRPPERTPSPGHHLTTTTTHERSTTMSNLDAELARELYGERLDEVGDVRRAQRAAAAHRLQRRAARLSHKAERVSRRAERAASQARLAVARVL